MASEKRSEEPWSAEMDDKIRRILDDPEVKARIREIKKEIERGTWTGPGIGPEELPDFLREHGF